ncbi:MAG TPA: nitroreductase/quinone reductase family protein [Amycolatopsis sp.]|nr:nitroreductase/quinone reductase family protein [Amycolatopsis sp.]
MRSVAILDPDDELGGHSTVTLMHFGTASTFLAAEPGNLRQVVVGSGVTSRHPQRISIDKENPMSFNTRNGTRGARQPSAGFLLRQVNRTAMNRIRRTGGKFMGMDALILTTIGAKSGAERKTPVGWFPGPDGSWLIVASAAGAPKNPAWYYNLAAHPDRIHIEVAGQEVPVTPEQLQGAERQQAWQQIIGAVPRFAQYQKKTDRELPIIRLTRRTG